MVNDRLSPAAGGRRGSLPWWEIAGRIGICLYLGIDGVVGTSYVWKPVLAGTMPQAAPLLAAVSGLVSVLAGILAATGRMALAFFVLAVESLVAVVAAVMLAAGAGAASSPAVSTASNILGFLPPLGCLAWLVVRWLDRRGRPGRILPAASVLLVVALLVSLPLRASVWGRQAGGSLVDRPRPDTVEEGMAVPPLSFTGLDGATVSLDDPETIYVLDFWATWCAPCRKELPELAALAKRLAGDDSVRILAVNVEEALSAKGLQESAMEFGIGELEVVSDPEDFYSALGFQSIPVTLVVRDRRILLRVDGYSEGTVGDVEEAIRAAR